MPGENDELTKQVRDWCKWFWTDDQKCRCGYWPFGKNDGQKAAMCPVLSAAKEKTGGKWTFVPEAIRGNPVGKDIIFLAVNPGLGGEEDKKTCPWVDSAGKPGGDWGNTLARANAYADFCLDTEGTAICDGDAYLGDKPTQFSVAVTAWVKGLNPRTPLVGPKDDLWKNVSEVALLNTAHCKSKEFRSFGIGEKRVPWLECGKRTLELIHIAKPKVVICYGWDTWYWLNAIKDYVKACGWTLSGFHNDNGFGQVSTLAWGDDTSTDLFWTQHPSRGHYRSWRIVTAHLPAVLRERKLWRR